MKTKQVRVTADENGKVVHRNKGNQEWGYIRVEQLRPTVNVLGILTIKKLSALISGKVSDLELLDYQPDQMLDGKIKIVESLDPFYQQNPNKHLKYVNKDSEIFCKKDGNPIYRKTIFTTNLSDEDVLIKHTNKEEIQSITKVDSDEDFSME